MRHPAICQDNNVHEYITTYMLKNTLFMLTECENNSTLVEDNMLCWARKIYNDLYARMKSDRTLKMYFVPDQDILEQYQRDNGWLNQTLTYCEVIIEKLNKFDPQYCNNNKNTNISIC